MAGSEQADRELAAAALRKRQAGKKPTREETAALRRIERRRDETMRAEAYASVPKKVWREWSGHLQHKTLDDLADRHGMPTRGATVDMPAVVGWLYRFLRENSRKLAAADSDEAEQHADPRIEIARWEAKRRQLKYRQEADETVDLADVERGFAVIAEILRRAGEAIRAEYGDSAAKILTNAWSDVRAKLDVLFAADDSDAA